MLRCFGLIRTSICNDYLLRHNCVLALSARLCLEEVPVQDGFLQVPNWFSVENQGGGIAVADLNGDGSLDLVVFMIDSPPGLNRGAYQVGRSLDASGNVTGGW